MSDHFDRHPKPAGRTFTGGGEKNLQAENGVVETRFVFRYGEQRFSDRRETARSRLKFGAGDLLHQQTPAPQQSGSATIFPIRANSHHSRVFSKRQRMPLPHILFFVALRLRVRKSFCQRGRQRSGFADLVGFSGRGEKIVNRACHPLRWVLETGKLPRIFHYR